MSDLKESIIQLHNFLYPKCSNKEKRSILVHPMEHYLRRYWEHLATYKENKEKFAMVGDVARQLGIRLPISLTGSQGGCPCCAVAYVNANMPYYAHALTYTWKQIPSPLPPDFVATMPRHDIVEYLQELTDDEIVERYSARTAVMSRYDFIHRMADAFVKPCFLFLIGCQCEKLMGGISANHDEGEKSDFLIGFGTIASYRAYTLQQLIQGSEEASNKLVLPDPWRPGVTFTSAEIATLSSIYREIRKSMPNEYLEKLIHKHIIRADAHLLLAMPGGKEIPALHNLL